MQAPALQEATQRSPVGIQPVKASDAQPSMVSNGVLSLAELAEKINTLKPKVTAATMANNFTQASDYVVEIGDLYLLANTDGGYATAWKNYNIARQYNPMNEIARKKLNETADILIKRGIGTYMGIKASRTP